jgi:hypothetical protein
MAIILQFRTAEVAAPRATKPADSFLGEIIIFPGVRIERRASGDTPKREGTPSGKRVQRSRKK